MSSLYEDMNRIPNCTQQPKTVKKKDPRLYSKTFLQAAFTPEKVNTVIIFLLTFFVTRGVINCEKIKKKLYLPLAVT